MSNSVPPSAQPFATSPSNEATSSYSLIEGPRWYRTRIRLWGPVLAVMFPAAVGAVGYFALQLSDAAWSGPLGLLGGYFGAPAMLAVGAPFGNRAIYPLAIAASGVMWLLVGVLASRRATRNPMATWADFWRHYAWMLGGIWFGVAAALVIATVRIGTGILDW